MNASSPDRSFATAWDFIDRAVEARRALADCWAELCEDECFDADVVPETDRAGRLDVRVFWPEALAERADEAAESFANAVKRAFDEALCLAADLVSGAIETPDRAAHEMPLLRHPELFTEAWRDGALRGLRPDQLQTAWRFQPFVEERPEDALSWAMLHLAELVGARASTRRRVGVWAHSAEPEFDARQAGATIRVNVEPDGLLEEVRTVARFTCEGATPHELAADPNIAFDAIFNDEPWPTDPDDNLMNRSDLLIRAATTFVRALERSVTPSSVRHIDGESFATTVSAIDGSPWEEVDLGAVLDGRQIDEALRASDLGIGTYSDPDGRIAMLLRIDGRTFARPIPPAVPLDPSIDPGPGAEAASLDAATFWGLPDFVMEPLVVRKGGGSREVGDGSIVIGRKGLAIQVKSRARPSNDDARERSWVLKKIDEGARQASGTIRFLRNEPVDLVNRRGRAVRVDGSDVVWVRVVIIDHAAPPEQIRPDSDGGAVPLVALLRRDWEFLFDQLRSVSAVVDYLFRVAGGEASELGAEPARYFELAHADTNAVDARSAAWARDFGVDSFSYPLLPTTPASSTDAIGHTVFRVILEDIAESPFEGGELDRLGILEMLDRFPICDRAELGRLLLSHLDDVVAIEDGTTKWQFRRVLLDEGQLQLAFGATNALTPLHHEAFRRWAMLRHHEFVQTPGAEDGLDRRTVAVLLTPRRDGVRPWDTTSFTLFGDIGLDTEDLAVLRQLWDRQSAA